MVVVLCIELVVCGLASHTSQSNFPVTHPSLFPLQDGIIASRSLSMLVVLATSSCRTHNRDFGATVPSPPLDVGVVTAHRRDMPSLT
ncbi:hypothetical protein F2Q70_00012139 [Brassica cretica]|uniref:Secreted protein n=1 Tax=Brassica cretica TaxID=69181 RepID=A0A8S9M288_BRACR|nr:hypothetical protein F2Q70_00012139 [Brassica cretica]